MTERRSDSAIARWLATASAALCAEVPQIAIATWRGCEEACQGFRDYLTGTGRDVEFTISDAAQDKARRPGILAAAHAGGPWRTGPQHGQSAGVHDRGRAGRLRHRQVAWGYRPCEHDRHLEPDA